MDKFILDEAISIVSSYVGPTNNWMIIKKELLKTLSPQDRMYFSTRDPVTKKQTMNTFEKIVAEKWRDKTGIYPILIDRNER
ncbi:MAG: hypothetical protein EBU90_28445 [Proteobacteria bacterium]|nr:hypothetical protein [Pseudomonadota bacterium]